jgi:autotransporter-associated beta strand protein
MAPDLRRATLLTAAAIALGLYPAAANPLGAPVGTATNVILGALTNPAAAGTNLHPLNLGYGSANLGGRLFNVRLPSGYSATNTTKKYGLVAYLDVTDTPVFPAAYAAALDARDVIWISPQGCGNATATTTRSGSAVMGAFRMAELYNIDPARVYAAGLSGGARVASEMGWLRPDLFRGLIGRVGAGLPAVIPSWSTGGNLGNADPSDDEDADYEYFFVWAGQPSVVLPPHFRTALASQYGDFRRSELAGIHRHGHLNHGNTSRLFMRPGGHSDVTGPNFADALEFMYHPLADLVWDRFENGLLAANFEPGKAVAGSGFTALAPGASETTYTYNATTHGVLRLAADGAAAASNDTFGWRDAAGVIVDARLRAENATTPGQNAQIGLHIVPANTTGPPGDQPGFHLYWCYGQPHRAEIVSADGVRRVLATWEHTAPHPMTLAANDRMFWDSAAAPDYAGRSRSFRGEDVRLALGANGFQLTFNRPAVNLATAYAGVVTAPTDTAPASPNENYPILLQGFWSEVETALVNGLPSGPWRVVLDNRALVPGQPVGAAVVDEIRIVGTGPQAAPPTLAVTAPSNTTRTLTWGRIHGAMSYRVERSSSPDGPFTEVAGVANTLGSHTDTVPQNIAYFYRVAALGADGSAGTPSPVGFAARNLAVPAAPSEATATYPAAFQVRVAWTDNANNETAYRVERSPAGFAQWTLVSGQLPANSTNFTDTGLPSGASYDYRISALNSGGLSAYATTAATVPDAAPPPPTGLAGTPTYASVDLAWNPSAGAATYRVKRSDNAGGPYNVIASGLTGTTFADTTFTPGATHYYVVSAISGSGILEADSAEIGIATLQLLPPSALTVTPGFTSNTLAWSAAAGAASYNILRATAAEGPFVTIATGLAGTTFTDNGLVSGTSYFYAVRSVSGSVASAATATVSGTPVPGTTTKANNTTALDQPASWSNNILPAPPDTARWDGTYTSGTAGIGAGLSVTGIQIAAPSTSITISAGTGSLTLGTGGLDLSAATQNFTSFAPVVLAVSQAWTVASNRIAQINAPVSDAGSARCLTVNGPGSVVLASDNTFTGTTAVSAGTLHLGPSGGATNGSLAGPLSLSGGIFRVNRTDACAPVGGTFHATAGNFQVAQASGTVTLDAINLPAGSSNSFASLTGTAGATFIVDAHPSASLAFGGSTAGINAVVKNGHVTFTTASSGFNFRIEGGSFGAPSSLDRFQLAATNGTQTFQLLGGAVDLSKVTSFGFRVGGSGNAAQAGAQNVTGTQSAGSLMVSFCTIGGTDTAANKNPSYSLGGGTFTATSTGATALQLGADAAGLGTSTFTLSGTGKLVIPGTISGAQAGARQIFTMTGGTLAAGTINFNNLRSAAGGTNGVFLQSGGTLAPGDLGPAGRTLITGAYTLGPGGALAVDVGGTNRATAFQNGQYDLVSITGTAALAGDLHVSLAPGYRPPASAVFTILTTTAGLGGAFGNAPFGQRLTTPGGEGSFVVEQSGGTVRLSGYRSSLETWRESNFGTTANTGPAADHADPDGDGVPNLVEYATGTLPDNASSTAHPQLHVSGFSPQPSHLTLTFNRIADPSLTYLVLGADSLTGPWQSVWQSTGDANIAGPVTVADEVDLSSLDPRQRFMRLKVSAPTAQ